MALALSGLLLIGVLLAGLAAGFSAGASANFATLTMAALVGGCAFYFVGSLIRQKRQLQSLEARIEDLTDQNWELREAAERHRSLTDAQGDFIVRRDTQGRVTYANEAFCRAFGLSENALIGAPLSLGVIEQNAAHVTHDGTRAIDEKIKTPAGERWIAWREVTVRDAVSGTAQVQSVGRDVTDRAEAERALIEARNQAESANRAKSRFLAMVSHEIRTPLNGILGMTELLTGTPLTAEQQTYAKAIKTSGDALLSLIEEVLDFSKIEAGRLNLEAQPFELDVLVEGLIELLAPRAHAKGLELAYHIDPRLARDVIGDPTRLRQVLLNLVGNGLKFAVEGGVALRIEPGERDSDVRFSIIDTGIGIAPQVQSKIFHEFEQADDGATRRFGGTGLGLAISKRIVERMGGSIAVESEIGRGATFSFTVALPVAAAAVRELVVPDLGGRSVVIVSPTRMEGPLLAEQLREWGAQTCLVQEAQVAVALIPERGWDVLIVDRALGAPETEMLARLAQPLVPTRLVLMTANDRHELPAFKEAGYSGYLVRPLRAQSLAARLIRPETAFETGPDANSLARERSAGQASPARALSILVAEDNEINALLARSLLVKLGHLPTMARNGAEALDLWLSARASGTPYDLVLMDAHMPEMDGLEATRRIRAAEVNTRTPIVALTANAFAEDRRACLEAGMDGFLTKPLDRDRLVEALALSPSLFTPLAA